MADENERQKNLMNFEIQHQTLLDENLETAKMNRIISSMDGEDDQKLKQELDQKMQDRIRSETSLMQTIEEKDQELNKSNQEIINLNIDGIINMLRKKEL